MKKRIAKKINKTPFLYSPKQLKCPGLTVTGQHNLVAGKTQELNIEGLNYPHNPYNGRCILGIIDIIDGQTFTFSSD